MNTYIIKRCFSTECKRTALFILHVLYAIIYVTLLSLFYATIIISYTDLFLRSQYRVFDFEDSK